jgi:hypothetical protein
MLVVMPGVAREDVLEVAAAKNEEPVEALAPVGAENSVSPTGQALPAE